MPNISFTEVFPELPVTPIIDAFELNLFSIANEFKKAFVLFIENILPFINLILLLDDTEKAAFFFKAY